MMFVTILFINKNILSFRFFADVSVIESPVYESRMLAVDTRKDSMELMVEGVSYDIAMLCFTNLWVKTCDIVLDTDLGHNCSISRTIVPVRHCP